MKTKYSELIVKILGIVIAVILAGLVIAWQAGLFKDKKQDLNSGTEKIDKVINPMADFDLLVYDGNTISGETLMDLITEYKSKEVKVSICVKTLDEIVMEYNYNYQDDNLGSSVTVTPPATKSSNGYITSSANFLGDVLKNKNGEIVCLRFTQQK